MNHGAACSNSVRKSNHGNNFFVEYFDKVQKRLHEHGFRNDLNNIGLDF